MDSSGHHQMSTASLAVAAPQHRRFVLSFVATSLLVLGGLAVLNVLADPYGAFGITLIPADSRTGDSRTARAEMIGRFEGETVLIGSSRTRVGYDGSLACVSGGPACNLGIDGTHLRELVHVVECTVRNARVRKIVLSVDLHLCATVWQPNADFQCSRFNPERSPLEHWGDLLWNGRTLEASLRAVRRQFSPRPLQHDAYGFAYGAATRFRDAPQSVRSAATLQQFCGPGGLLAHQAASSESCKYLQRIMDVCRQADVELTLVIDPVHCLLLEGMRASNRWEAYRQWKSSLVTQAAAAGVTVWDFTGYDRYTTEPMLELEADEAVWFWEPSHMRRELGNRVLQRLFADPAADPEFGEQLTPSRLERHFERLEQQRLAWRAGQSHEADALAALLHPAPADVAHPTQMATQAQAAVTR